MYVNARVSDFVTQISIILVSKWKTRASEKRPVSRGGAKSQIHPSIAGWPCDDCERPKA